MTNGKEKIETAVENEPNNPEIRYLRLSVQQNAPTFLGYDKDVQTDKTFLIKNMDKIEQAAFRNRIEKLLKS